MTTRQLQRLQHAVWYGEGGATFSAAQRHAEAQMAQHAAATPPESRFRLGRDRDHADTDADALPSTVLLNDAALDRILNASDNGAPSPAPFRRGSVAQELWNTAVWLRVALETLVGTRFINPSTNTHESFDETVDRVVEASRVPVERLTGLPPTVWLGPDLETVFLEAIRGYADVPVVTPGACHPHPVGATLAHVHADFLEAYGRTRTVEAVLPPPAAPRQARPLERRGLAGPALPPQLPPRALFQRDQRARAVDAGGLSADQFETPENQAIRRATEEDHQHARAPRSRGVRGSSPNCAVVAAEAKRNAQRWDDAYVPPVNDARAARDMLR